MASVESSSKICALCTKCTAFSIHSILEGDGDGGGGDLLQRFNCQFDLLPTYTTTISDNWSICHTCLPDIQLAVQSKGNVDKMEGEVRKLQLELLRQLENLKEEVYQMEGHLRKIKQTVLESLTSPPPKSTELSLIGIFQQKIITVVQDLQTWQMSTSTKLLQKEEPFIKEEEPFEDPEPDFPSYDDNYLDNLEPGQHWLFFQDNPDPTPRPPPPPAPTLTNEPKENTEEPPKKLRRSAAPKKYFEQNDSSSSSFDDDPDFDPNDLTISKPLASDILKNPQKLLKGLSPFRRALISRVRSRNTTSTSTSIPYHDKSDPRRPFAIKYNSVGSFQKRNRFYLEDHEIICLDEEEALQCGSCDYKVELSKLASKWHNIEDSLFEHILKRHLNLYTCLECGMSFESWFILRAHRPTHLGKEERDKFWCEICGKPLMTGQSLRKHKWTHLNEEEKKMEENQWMMPSHLRGTLVKGLRFQCATCGMEAKTESNLRIHERTHLGMEEREEDMVICTECGVKMLKNNLKRHRRRRHGGDGGVEKKGKRGRKGK